MTKKSEECSRVLTSVFTQASNSRERRRCVFALETRLVFTIDTLFFAKLYKLSDFTDFPAGRLNDKPGTP